MNDDKIAQLIAGMRVAAREDWDLNENKKPAVKNCNVEPDHVPTEQGGPADGPVEANVIMFVMTDCLAPMPDKSLASPRP